MDDTAVRDEAAAAHVLERDWRIAKLVDAIGVPGPVRPGDPFSGLAHSVIEQMMSITAAARIEGRLRELCGGRVTPAAVLACTPEQLRSCGMSGRKAATLLGLAAGFDEERFAALADATDDEVRSFLGSFKGIGDWTTDMFLMFQLARPDVIPTGDATFVSAFTWLYGSRPTPEVVRAVCEVWHPYASFAARCLYRAFDMGLPRKGPAAGMLW